MMYKHKLGKLLAISVLTITCFANMVNPGQVFAINTNERRAEGKSSSSVLDILVPEKINFNYKDGILTSSDYVVQNNSNMDVGITGLDFVLTNGWEKAQDPSALPAMPANTKQMTLNANIKGQWKDIINTNTTRANDQNADLLDMIYKTGSAESKKTYELKGQTTAITKPINEQCGTLVLTLKMAETPKPGDTVEMGDYIFTYDDKNPIRFAPGADAAYYPGWNVKVRDGNKDKTQYGPIPPYINGYPVVSLQKCFFQCQNMTKMPEGGLPDTLLTLNAAFSGCRELNDTPVIPNSVLNMEYAFQDCSKLETAPVIPTGMINISQAFTGCSSLLNPPPYIPNGILSAYMAFQGCNKLTTVKNGVDTPIRIYMTQASGGINYHAWAFQGTTLPISITCPYQGPNEKLSDLDPSVQFVLKEMVNSGTPDGGQTDEYGLLSTNVKYRNYNGEKVPMPNEKPKENKLEEGQRYIKADGTELKVGDALPNPPEENDKFIEGDYTYILTNGEWKVTVNSKEQTQYGIIRNKIGEKAVTNLEGTFKDCVNLIHAPEIPETINNANHAFENCYNMSGDLKIQSETLTYVDMFKNTAFDVGTNTYKTKILLQGKETNKALLESIHNENPFNTILGNSGEAVKKGHKYIVAKTGEEILPGNNMPAPAAVGDKYITADYTYTAFNNNGTIEWNVKVNDPNKEKYEELLETIGSKEQKVTTIDKTFQNCVNLIESPVLHQNIKSAVDAFNGCGNLTKVVFKTQNISIVSDGMFTNAGTTIKKKVYLVADQNNNWSVTQIHEKFKDTTTMDPNDTEINPNPDVPQFDGPVVPEGHKYIVAGQPPIEVPAGSKMPAQPKTGDKYVTADYTYTAMGTQWNMEKWSVKVNDTTKTSYEPILETIANKQVQNANGTFQNCVNLEIAPTVPKTITSMKNMFNGCKNLKEVGFANVIYQEGNFVNIFTNAGGTKENTKVFIHSEPLQANSEQQSMAVKIHSKHKKNTKLQNTKDEPKPGTVLLTGEKYIVNSNPKVTLTEGEALQKTPTIGDQLITTDYTYTCYDDNGTLAWKVKVNPSSTGKETLDPLKRQIVDAPMNNITNAFENCKGLITTPTIPGSVTKTNGAFKNCTNLKDVIIENKTENFTSYSNMFKNAGSVRNPVIVHMNVVNQAWACEANGKTLKAPFNTKNVKVAWEGATADLPPEGRNEEQPPVQNNDFQYIPTGTTTPVAPDQPLPPPQIGDKCVSKDYEYTLTDIGWKVNLNPDAQGKIAFDALANEINGEPITNIEGLFSGNETIETAPLIPATVTNAKDAFADCPNLKGPVYIQSENLNCDDMFDDAGENNPDTPIVLIGSGTEANNKLLEEIIEENDDANLVIGTPEKYPLKEPYKGPKKNETTVPNEKNPEQKTDEQNEIPPQSETPDVNTNNEGTEIPPEQHQNNNNNTTPDVNVPKNNQQNTKPVDPPVLEGQQGLEENNQQPSDTEADQNSNTEKPQQPEQINPPVNTEGNNPEKETEQPPIIPEETPEANNPPEVINYTKKIMVDNVLYKETKQLNNHHDGIITGTLTSSIDGPGDPTINDQSNFGIGFQYTKRETTIEVKIDEKWVVFESEVQNTEPQNDQIAQENTENDLQVQENIPGSNTQPPVNNETLEQVPTESEQNNAQSQNQEKPIIPDATEMEQTQPEQENNNTSENTNKEPENPPESLPEPQTEEKPQQEQPQPQLENSVPSEPPVLEGPPVVEKTQPENPPVEEPVVEEPQQINENPVQEETPQVQEEPTIEPEPPVIEGPIVEEPVA